MQKKYVKKNWSSNFNQRTFYKFQEMFALKGKQTNKQKTVNKRKVKTKKNTSLCMFVCRCIIMLYFIGTYNSEVVHKTLLEQIFFFTIAIKFLKALI